jgi:hypothetical protein
MKVVFSVSETAAAAAAMAIIEDCPAAGTRQEDSSEEKLERSDSGPGPGPGPGLTGGGGDRGDADPLPPRKPEDDDWETASEGDGENDDGDGGSSRTREGSKPPESFEDAMTEEEQKQVSPHQTTTFDGLSASCPCPFDV